VERKILVRKKLHIPLDKISSPESPKKDSKKQSVVLSRPAPRTHTLFTPTGQPCPFPLFDDAEVGLDQFFVADHSIEQQMDDDVASDDEIMGNAMRCCRRDVREAIDKSQRFPLS
jgi:hypothetical protein